MVHYFIYAKDYSGSTGGCDYYHENGLKTLAQFKNDVEKIKAEMTADGKPLPECKTIYLHWGSNCYEVDEDTTIRSYINREGNMGTEPRTIIDWIKRHYNICHNQNDIKLLYIITDGYINARDANVCFELNRDMKYECVVFHAFNERLEQIDLSVAASFFKNRCISYRNNELFDNVDISQQFDYDKINIDNFYTTKDEMTSYIRLKFIKSPHSDSNSLNEIDKLKKLRGRLFAELEAKGPQKPKINLNTKDKNEFLQNFVKTDWYKGLSGPIQDIKVDIETTVSTLMNYITSNKKSYKFDALKLQRTYNTAVEEEEMIDVNFPPEQEIEFPDIILDDEKGIPVIILNDLDLLQKIIFHNETSESADVTPASFSKFKSSMDCPLYLLNDADISQSIGYFYTLTVYKQFLENGVRTEPRTRQPFHGGLVLTDTDHFDKYNDYIIAATYFNSKKVNCNIGLFYYVLLKNCENKEWMDRNVVEQFKKYVMRRISKAVCIIGLSSLPLDPPMTTSLPTALWYCLELSSCIFKHDPEHYQHERLRMYSSVASSMIEILSYFNYDLDLESIGKRRDVIRHVMTLKRIPKQEDKVYYLLERIFKKDRDFLISEIEKPQNLNKLNYLKLNHKEMLSDDIVNEKVHLNEFVHLMHFQGDLDPSKPRRGKVERLCEKTFRPFFTIDEKTSFYTQLVAETKRVIINNDDNKDKINITYEPVGCLEFDRTMSLCNLFNNCVTDLAKYPTLEEYMDYIHKKKKFHGELVTIFPKTVCSAISHIYELYQTLTSKIELSRYISVSRHFYNRLERIKAEQRVQFKDDDEINKFIYNEEIKVRIKKPSNVNS